METTTVKTVRFHSISHAGSSLKLLTHNHPHLHLHFLQKQFGGQCLSMGGTCTVVFSVQR